MLRQRWTSCWRQRPRSCLDKCHPDGHIPPLGKNGLTDPAAVPVQNPQPWVMGRGGSARPPEQPRASAAPVPHLGWYWREGGALLAGLQLGGNKTGRSKIKNKIAGRRTGGCCEGTGGMMPCSPCALARLQPGRSKDCAPAKPALSCYEPRHSFLLKIKPE